MTVMPHALLILEDGTVFEGESFGAIGSSTGEIVFNTSSTGYQEILTDPSYRYQIVVMTSPHVGNYGLDAQVDQSDRPQVAGFVVREISPHEQSLDGYLREHGIPGIEGIDTRALTRRIRAQGAAKGMITTEVDRPIEELKSKLEASPSMAGLDLVRDVTSLRPWILEPEGEKIFRVALYDFGVKKDILRKLTAAGCEVVIYPASTHPDEIINHQFDGVVLSNGPGDPEPVNYAQDNIRRLLGKVPILGICLGHQLLGLALGGRTYKMKFGHHGGNHPVRDIASGKVEITAQNHGFAIDPQSLSEADVEYTHINLNDQTLEGFRHRREPVIAVQYHPEAAPGPHDSFGVFAEFLAMIRGFRKDS